MVLYLLALARYWGESCIRSWYTLFRWSVGLRITPDMYRSRGWYWSMVYAMADIFSNDSWEAVILLDAENAFDCLNREVALHNMQLQYPSIARFLSNTYNIPAQLHLWDGSHITSEEGTTQGRSFCNSNLCHINKTLNRISEGKYQGFVTGVVCWW